MVAKIKAGTGMVVLGALLLLPAAPGCVDRSQFVNRDVAAPGDGGSGDALLRGVVSLRVLPADAVLTIVDGNAAVQAYQAMGKLADGTERDVTAMTSFSAEDLRLGLFAKMCSPRPSSAAARPRSPPRPAS